ncbi:copper homeostasis protein CutC [Streptomyces marispadix]|uniref:Copper homeostasis protein cutC homolog n=1 Tax=Streptomyces marispadix TaxID=2922868 RepID=A0ABS9SXQ0_9ACTN|nr:copper homeostasis protein CutC [Streptomyces marispadix]MCH6160988.1 copper homeostasis protein CutC [Streptomyces marispadix]
MSRPILEVIALDADDARAAHAGGADRLELVTDMAADGLTPPRETFARVRAAVDLPVRVMLRGNAGFTVGDDAALDVLRAQARALRAEGADEFVLGFLDAEGHPDLHAITALTDVIGPCPWTFHRAVDHAADRARLREALTEFAEPGHGPDAYLTAGSPAGVDEGLDVLRSEAARSAAAEPGHGPTVVAGGGLRLQHVAPLAEAGVTAFHIGTAARPTGWSGPADARLVREWREALDA